MEVHRCAEWLRRSGQKIREIERPIGDEIDKGQICSIGKGIRSFWKRDFLNFTYYFIIETMFFRLCECLLDVSEIETVKLGMDFKFIARYKTINQEYGKPRKKRAANFQH